MVSYITQMITLRADNRALLGKLVTAFGVGKCVKKVEYFIKTSDISGIAKHEALIYYTTPLPPVVELTAVTNELYTDLTLTITSPIAFTLIETGVVYNNKGNPTIDDIHIVFPAKYGVTVKSILTDTLAGENLYFAPYIITCMGAYVGEQVSITTNKGIGFDIIEYTLTVY